MKELILKPREDGKRRVQLLIPNSIYEDFVISLIDEFGYINYKMSEISSDLWLKFAEDQKKNYGNIQGDIQINKKHIIKLKKSISKLIDYKKDINESELFELFEETTICIDERTYKNYIKILRKIEVLGKPNRLSGFKCMIYYPINIEISKKIIEDLEENQESKNYQKQKINRQDNGK